MTKQEPSAVVKTHTYFEDNCDGISSIVGEIVKEPRGTDIDSNPTPASRGRREACAKSGQKKRRQKLDRKC